LEAFKPANHRNNSAVETATLAVELDDTGGSVFNNNNNNNNNIYLTAIGFSPGGSGF
jgi:hypothetical protein